MVFYITIAKALIGYIEYLQTCKIFVHARFAKGVGQNIEFASSYAYNHFLPYLHFLLCGWWHQGVLLWSLHLLMKISFCPYVLGRRNLSKITASSVLLFLQSCQATSAHSVFMSLFTCQWICRSLSMIWAGSCQFLRLHERLLLRSCWGLVVCQIHGVHGLFWSYGLLSRQQMAALSGNKWMIDKTPNFFGNLSASSCFMTAAIGAKWRKNQSLKTGAILF